MTVPFNVACGRCRTCREQQTGVCLNVNPARAGGAYGYVDMGGWIGGQAEYVMVPYADFNLLKFPDKGAGDGEDPRPDDALPISCRPAFTAPSVRTSALARPCISPAPGQLAWPRPRRRRFWARPSCMIGDMNEERLAHAKRSASSRSILTKTRQARRTRSSRFSACRKWTLRSTPSASRRAGTAGSTRRSAGDRAQRADGRSPAPAARSASPASMSPKIPARTDKAAQQGNLRMRFGLGWAKSHRFQRARRRSCATTAS